VDSGDAKLVHGESQLGFGAGSAGMDLNGTLFDADLSGKPLMIAIAPSSPFTGIKEIPVPRMKVSRPKREPFVC
jgi:hypothetical protein